MIGEDLSQSSLKECGNNEIVVSTFKKGVMESIQQSMTFIVIRSKKFGSKPCSKT